MKNIEKKILCELDNHADFGITTIGIATAIRITITTAIKYLKRLESDGLVIVKRYGSAIVYFPVKKKEVTH